MTYHAAADEQKKLCEQGHHVHSVMETEDKYYLTYKKPEHPKYECCPCFWL